MEFNEGRRWSSAGRDCQTRSGQTKVIEITKEYQEYQKEANVLIAEQIAGEQKIKDKLAVTAGKLKTSEEMRAELLKQKCEDSVGIQGQFDLCFGDLSLEKELVANLSVQLVTKSNLLKQCEAAKDKVISEFTIQDADYKALQDRFVDSWVIVYVGYGYSIHNVGGVIQGGWSLQAGVGIDVLKLLKIKQ